MRVRALNGHCAIRRDNHAFLSVSSHALSKLFIFHFLKTAIFCHVPYRFATPLRNDRRPSHSIASPPQAQHSARKETQPSTTPSAPHCQASGYSRSFAKFLPHIFATMSGMLDLSIDEKAKHFLPRWFSDAPTWMSTALSSVRARRTNFFICSNASYICPS